MWKGGLDMEFHDLEDKLSEDLSKHPEGCTCGKCGHDHSHEGQHVPKHTHGKGAYKDLDRRTLSLLYGWDIHS